jgi:hypothetical protein
MSAGSPALGARRGQLTENGPENGMIAGSLPNPATCGRNGNQLVSKAGEGPGGGRARYR